LQRPKGCEQLMGVAQSIAPRVRGVVSNVQREVISRSSQASNHLRSASLHVLRGQRSGIKYRVPHTRRRWTASAPGEAPAVRTGIFRMSWRPQTHVEKHGSRFRAISAIVSSLKVGRWLLGDLLENGTRKMAPRPFKQSIRDRAMPEIMRVFRKPFNL